MVVVTRDNFQEIYPRLKLEIQNATFVAIDEEMTGIQDTQARGRNSKIDTPDARYLKMVGPATRYSIIQLGIAIFTAQKSPTGESDGGWKVSVYTFYLFPDSANRDICMAPSSIDFLRKNNMDFGTWISKGVTFADESGEQWLMKKFGIVEASEEVAPQPQPSDVSTSEVTMTVEAPSNASDSTDAKVAAPEVPAVPTEATTSTNSTNSTASEAATTPAAPGAPAANAWSNQREIVLTKDSDKEYETRNMTALNAMMSDESGSLGDSYTFEYSNAYIRRYVYQYVEKHYPDSITMSKDDNNRLVAKKVSKAEKAENDILLQRERMKSYEDALGFRNVFKDLIKAKLPIVGHNCFFDFLFMMRWLDGPLAADLTTFKSRFQQLFPNVYDTKWIAASGVLGEDATFSDTVLGDLYNQMVLGQPSANSAAAAAPATADTTSSESSASSNASTNNKQPIIPIHVADGDSQVEQLHDAGYDALCTGSIFAVELMKIGGLERMQTLASQRLFMMQSLYHMDLCVDRPNGWMKFNGVIIHLSNFDASTVTADIINVFTLAGFSPNILDLVWIDGTSAFIIIDMPEESFADTFARAVLPNGWAVMLYEEYLAKKALEDEAAVEGQENKRARIES